MKEDAGAALITGPSAPDIDAALVVNGRINLHKTHPTLYRQVMSIGVIQIALGLNFLVGEDVLGLLAFTPTFFVWDMPNGLWAAFFLLIGVGEIVFLNLYVSLWLTRRMMDFDIAFLMFFGYGTMQPAFEGKGSLQLPILYAGMVALLVWLVLEPFLNPWTARRD